MNYSLFGGNIGTGQIVTFRDELDQVFDQHRAQSIPLWENINRELLTRGEGYRVARSFEAPVGHQQGAFLELEGFEGIPWPINMFRRGGTIAARETFAVGPDLTATEIRERIPQPAPITPWQMMQERVGEDLGAVRPWDAPALAFPTAKKKSEPDRKYGVDYS